MTGLRLRAQMIQILEDMALRVLPEEQIRLLRHCTQAGIHLLLEEKEDYGWNL